jgi:hypothetical protein
MSNAVIGALRVNLGLDSAQFQDGLKKSQDTASRFGAALRTTLVAAAAAASAALAGLASSVRSTLNSMDDMSKSASKIGIPIEELSRLKYAADLSGVSMEGLQTSVGRLSRTMSDAASGGKASAQAFGKLGINVKNADGQLKSSSQILGEIADRFAAMPDGAQKTALAMELMGRSGANMIPMLNGGSDALNKLLNEAKDFGLTISGETGRAAEAFNDNLARIGYAASGVGVALTAALLPVLVPISEAMVSLAQSIVNALQHLPTLAEYAAVAGSALAIMFAPSLIAAAGNLAVAIGTGLVGAVRLLTAAIAANPLGALAIAITVAVTAIYHFRDEIRKAIGVDVVKIVKDSINTVIGVFVGGFEAVTATWTQLPAALGDLAYQAGYLLADNIRYWINEAILLVDGFIGTLNEKIGTSIGRLSTLAPVKNGNPYKGAAAGVAGAASAAMSAALSRDYIDEITQAFTGAAPAATNFADALSGVNSQLDDMGGAGGGGKGGGGKLQKVKAAVKDVKSEAEKFANAMSGAFSGLGSGIAEAIKGTKSWRDVALDALSAVAQAVLSSMNFGGGLFGSVFKGLLGGLFGGFRASGGPVTAGRAYVVGERGPELMVPNASGTIVPNHALNDNRGGGVVDVRVAMDRNGNLQAYVERTSGRVSAQVVRAAAPGIVEASTNSVQQAARARPGFFR